MRTPQPVDPARSVKVVIDRLEVWEGTRDHPVRLESVESWAFQAFESFNRAELVVDPWQAVGLCQRLRERRVKVTEFVFSSGSVGRLASTLHTLLRDQALALPDDEALLEELAGVRLREVSPGVVRMDHDPGRHDDTRHCDCVGCSAFVADADHAGRGGEEAGQEPGAPRYEVADGR